MIINTNGDVTIIINNTKENEMEWLDKEVEKQMKVCTKLLRENPGFVTQPENGYAHVKVVWNELYEESVLWVAQNLDKTMTLIDLQQLELHIRGEI